MRDAFVNVDIDARTLAAGFLELQETAVFNTGRGMGAGG